MIVVDSAVWIDFFKGQMTPATMHLSQLLGHEPILVGDLILCEVLQGARDARQARDFEFAMRKCELAEMSGSDLAIAAAAKYRQLRAAGITVRKTIDMLIGTYCIMNRHTLLHSDRDYNPMELHLGLKVVPTHYMVNEPRVAYG
jgi:predicted nucleic acid-binding protein